MRNEPSWVLSKVEGAEALEGREGLGCFLSDRCLMWDREWEHTTDQDLLSKKNRKQVAPELRSLFSVQQVDTCPIPKNPT